MGLRIYNSLSNQIEDFEPIEQGKVRMYVCGPTVYNYIHIGNARPVVFYDMLKNYLEFCGYQVDYVSNVTDVDDKIIQQAEKEHKSEKEIAAFYEDAYFKAVELIGSKRPSQVPHATDYIEEMIRFIKQLMEEGYAYEVDGDVFFRVHKIKDYGILSNQVSAQLEQGARISVNEKRKIRLILRSGKNGYRNSVGFSVWIGTSGMAYRMCGHESSVVWRSDRYPRWGNGFEVSAP